MINTHTLSGSIFYCNLILSSSEFSKSKLIIDQKTEKCYLKIKTYSTARFWKLQRKNIAFTRTQLAYNLPLLVKYFNSSHFRNKNHPRWIFTEKTVSVWKLRNKRNKIRIVIKSNKRGMNWAKEQTSASSLSSDWFTPPCSHLLSYKCTMVFMTHLFFKKWYKSQAVQIWSGRDRAYWLSRWTPAWKVVSSNPTTKLPLLGVWIRSLTLICSIV